MKISNRKKQLAKIISENGGWSDGAGFVAQDKRHGGRKNNIGFYRMRPVLQHGGHSWRTHNDDCGGIVGGWIDCEKLISNWHQTILSRDEYLHLYPAPDADGWIEFDGTECPSGCFNKMIDVKLQDGRELTYSSCRFDWDTDGQSRITAYRLHKPEQAKSEFCESVMRSIPEPDGQVWTNPPTIEQLAADYRNKLDCSNRKQDEADKANMESDAALSELEAAIAAIGFAITPLVEVKQEPELVITDWRDLQVGDEIEVFYFDDHDDWNQRKAELMSGVCVVMRTGSCVHIELKSNLPKERDYWNTQGVDKCKFRFIRRP